jgi:hypothetical protein
MNRETLVRALVTGGIVLTALWCASIAVAVALLLL